MLRIKLVKSPIGHNPRNRATIEALGLSKVGQIVEKEDNSSIRGMIHKIHNLLIVEATDGSAPIVDALNTPIAAALAPKKKVLFGLR